MPCCRPIVRTGFPPSCAAAGGDPLVPMTSAAAANAAAANATMVFTRTPPGVTEGDQTRPGAGAARCPNVQSGCLTRASQEVPRKETDETVRSPGPVDVQGREISPGEISQGQFPPG